MGPVVYVCVTGGFTDVAVSDTAFTVVVGIPYLATSFVFQLLPLPTVLFYKCFLFSSFTNFLFKESCM